MQYRTIFDVTHGDSDWWIFSLVGALLSAFGIAAIWYHARHPEALFAKKFMVGQANGGATGSNDIRNGWMYGGKTRKAKRQQARFAIVKFLFIGFWTFGAIAFTMVTLAMGVLRDRQLRNGLKSEKFEVVEGVVTNFIPELAKGHSDETFDVGDHHYALSHYTITGGYHETQAHGGVFREGLRVRIADVDGVIVRLEVATDSSARPVTANAAVRAADTIPTGTNVQAESLLVDVQSLDKTIAVDMRYRNAGNFTGAALPGYEGNHALMRREAAVALAAVQASLRPQGLGLKIWDAYRPVRATLEMVAWTVRVHRENLVRDGYIADKSKHNLGVAIDLTLIKLADGKELDMGTPHDEFSTNAHTANATGAVAANRAILVNAMAAQKFANYDQEWWHFSFDVPNPLRFDMVVR